MIFWWPCLRVLKSWLFSHLPFLPPPLNFPSYLLLLVLLCPPAPKLYVYLVKPSKGTSAFWVSAVGPALRETLWIACGFCNLVPHTQELRTTQGLWCSSEGQESKMSLSGVKARCQQGCIPSEALGVLPSFPQFLELSCISWLAPSYTFKASNDRLRLSHTRMLRLGFNGNISFSNSITLSSIFKDPCDYI